MTEALATVSAPAADQSSMFDDIPKTGQPPTYSYTNLVMRTIDGFWLCPLCPQPINSRIRTALETRGYKEIPKEYNDETKIILKCYGKDHTNKLYFANPACAVRCQNHWNTGFDGDRCMFDREQTEGFRNEDLEKLYDKKRGPLGYCSQCSVPVEIAQLDPAREAYIKNLQGLDVIKREGSSYVDRSENPWSGPHDTYMRTIFYNGTVESLQCKTNKWGEGNGKASEDKPCQGGYGRPITFYHPIEEEKIDRLRKMVETGKFIPEEGMVDINGELVFHPRKCEPEPDENENNDFTNDHTDSSFELSSSGHDADDEESSA